MTNNLIRQKVRDCLAQAFEMKPEDLPPNADVENVPAWDSLGHMMLLEQLNIVYPDRFTQDVFQELLSEDELVGFLEQA